MITNELTVNSISAGLRRIYIERAPSVQPKRPVTKISLVVSKGYMYEFCHDTDENFATNVTQLDAELGNQFLTSRSIRYGISS